MPKGFEPAYDITRLFQAKLKSSGLTWADATILKMQAQPGSAVRTLGFPWKFQAPFFTIPYVDPWGDGWGEFARARLLIPPPTPDTPKYTQVKNTPPHVYFPPRLLKRSWKVILTDPDTPVYITEGELKAAAATKRGYPTIGLGGVWNFKSRRHDIKFLSELDRVAWTGRRVTIIYDSDLKDKPDVQRAKQVLANELIQRGATVMTLDIPAAGEAKVGLDDLLLTVTNAQFEEMIDAKSYEMGFGWQLMYESKEGKPFPIVYNAEIALSISPEFDGMFYWDRFRNTEMVSRPILGYATDETYPRPLQDADCNVALSWIQRLSGGGIMRATSHMVNVAIANVAQKDQRHPLKDYLDDLRWDGTPRLKTWLLHTFGVAPSPYTEAVAKYFFMGMVARVRSPGCQLDYMLVIEGDQGLRKSTICRTIAGGEEFFATMTHERDSTRTSQLLRAKWVIEFDELSAIKKSDIEEIKGFVTRRSEKFIAKYARKETREDRSCVFIGTTNEFEYLRDIDNRRFWPVHAVKDDAAWLEENRDQLFAEATQLYDDGEKYYPDREFENLYFKPEQDRRRVLDDYVIEVSEFVELRAIDWAESNGGLKNVMRFEVIPRDVSNAPKFAEERMGAVYQRVNAALRMLGWKEIRRVHNVPRYSPRGPAITRIEERAARMADERAASENRVVRLRPKKY